MLLISESKSQMQYPILSAEELKTSILPNIYKGLVEKNLNKKFLQVLFLEQTESFCVSYITVKPEDGLDKLNLVYILCKKIDQAVQSLENLRTQLLKLIDFMEQKLNLF